MKDIFKKLFGDYKWFVIFPTLLELLLDFSLVRSFIGFPLQLALFVLVPVLTVVFMFKKRSRGFRKMIILGFLFWLVAFLWVTGGPGFIMTS